MYWTPPMAVRFCSSPPRRRSLRNVASFFLSSPSLASFDGNISVSFPPAPPTLLPSLPNLLPSVPFMAPAAALAFSAAIRLRHGEPPIGLAYRDPSMRVLLIAATPSRREGLEWDARFFGTGLTDLWRHVSPATPRRCLPLFLFFWPVLSTMWAG